MISSNDIMAKAQSAQLAAAREQLQALLRDRETYIRLVACLANALKAGQPIADVGGHVGIPRADFDAVPELYTVNVQQARTKAEGAGEEDDGVDMLVMMVEPRPAANGFMAAHKPRLVVP